MSKKIPSVLLLTVTASTTLAMVFGTAVVSNADSRALKVGTQAITNPVVKADASVRTVTSNAAVDSFTREVGSGWGQANTGGGWTVTGAPGGTRVVGGKGQALGVKPGTTMRAALNSVNALDVVNAADFTVGDAGNSQYLSVENRKQASSANSYRAVARVEANGQAVLSLRRIEANGAETTLVNNKAIGSFPKGTVLRVQLSTSGTSAVTIQARAWAGGTVPGWQVSTTDSSAARVAKSGSVAYNYYVSSNAPRSANVSLDNVTATATTTVANPPVTTPTPTPSNPTPPPAASKPVKRDASNTGVPAGVKLKPYTGSLTITKAGTVLDGYDIKGNMWIKAPNVTIKNSRITNGPSSVVQGVVTILPEGKGLLLQDSEVKVTTPSVTLDGVKGGGFTMRRVHVSGGVDAVKAYGNDVLIEDSYMHSTNYFASDPFQRGGPTHNDIIQVQGGNNITIRNNTLIQVPTHNAALQVTQDHLPLTKFAFTGNYVDGGTCSANFNHKKQKELRGFGFSNNTFGRNTKHRNCAYLTTNQVFSASDVSTNKWTDGAAVWQKYM